jgi:hypothetical protein
MSLNILLIMVCWFYCSNAVIIPIYYLVLVLYRFETHKLSPIVLLRMIHTCNRVVASIVHSVRDLLSGSS